MNIVKNLIFSTLALGISASAGAGIYSDDLSRCLVESSTEEDKIILVKWIFTAMSLHPAVSSMSSVSNRDRDLANKATAETFVKLLTETCKPQAIKAIRYEGGFAIQQGFTVFGQVAGQELFANPNVAASLSGLEEHIDTEKLNNELAIEQDDN